MFLVETFEASASSRRRRCRVGLPKPADSKHRCLGGRLDVESNHICISCRLCDHSTKVTFVTRDLVKADGVSAEMAGDTGVTRGVCRHA